MGLLFSSQAGGGAGTRPGEGEDKTSWWFKFGAKAMGSIGGVIAMATGVVACISFSATCIVAGVLQM